LKTPPLKDTIYQTGPAPSAAVRAALLRWYRTHARPLPWRSTTDAYTVWVSEVMLQQTQVATVIPYFERFLSAFPTCDRLARAPFRRVAELWSGLGYYRRARLLHRAAQTMLRNFDGRFPNRYDVARSLPGIGHYTASAVLSIAYRAPLAVVDGNVARVMARLDALRGNLQEVAFRKQVEKRLGELLSRRRPGDFNQAIMELGQLVCLPRRPRCPACPVRKHCRAALTGDPERYPAPRPRRSSETRHLAAAVIVKDGQVGLVRGLDDNLLADLWNFPSAFGSTPREALERLCVKLRADGVTLSRRSRRLGSIRHRITFRNIVAEAYEISGADAALRLRWFTWDSLRTAAVSQLARKIAELARSHFAGSPQT
jgi:A/G-specific adenine glycosylase